MTGTQTAGSVALHCSSNNKVQYGAGLDIQLHIFENVGNVIFDVVEE
jgi:hypothetical protein